jgi:hypothetical protein
MKEAVKRGNVWAFKKGLSKNYFFFLICVNSINDYFKFTDSSNAFNPEK